MLTNAMTPQFGKGLLHILDQLAARFRFREAADALESRLRLLLHVGEFIAVARKDPGKLNVGTSPVGTGGYMSAELFKLEAGLDIAIIPYKGTGPLINDLVGGHVPIAFGVLPPAMGNLQAGTLRAIAVAAAVLLSISTARIEHNRS